MTSQDAGNVSLTHSWLVALVQAARRIVARRPQIAQDTPFSTPCMAWRLWFMPCTAWKGGPADFPTNSKNGGRTGWYLLSPGSCSPKIWKGKLG